nr:MAG TPA: hypothetical protein [Caudoviricetes sp.]DAV50662.1 MAG TPA: hypothetical protein [Caudoviricetes sp.]
MIEGSFLFGKIKLMLKRIIIRLYKEYRYIFYGK